MHDGTQVRWRHNMRSQRKVCRRIACQQRWQQRRYQGRGQREPLYCSLKRDGPIGKVLAHRRLSKNYQQQRQVVWTSSTPKCLPKQGMIAAQISHTTRKVKQTNGKENVIVRSNRPMEGKMWLYPSIRYISIARKARMSVENGDIESLP